MGTAREDLIEMLYEALYDVRKPFGMHGQIRISILDVTPLAITVGIGTNRRLEGAQVVHNVRNAVLGLLRDLLPVERFVAIYDNPTLGIEGEVYDLPYADALTHTGEQRSSVILIAENADPLRESLRPRFAAAWERLVDEAER